MLSIHSHYIICREAKPVYGAREMAESGATAVKRDPLQIRFTPRIHDLIKARQKVNNSTMKAEIEELIVKGTQLEQLLAPKFRLALDVLISLLNDDPKGII